MDYLVELYNKHIEENTGQKYYLNERNVKDRLDSLLTLRYFIKRLIENDKIDTDELLGIYWETRQSIWEANKYELYSEYKRLLMLLAIQDEPIEFLCSLLK